MVCTAYRIKRCTALSLGRAVPGFGPNPHGVTTRGSTCAAANWLKPPLKTNSGGFAGKQPGNPKVAKTVAEAISPSKAERRLPGGYPRLVGGGLVDRLFVYRHALSNQ